jgi:hypothetical protein
MAAMLLFSMFDGYGAWDFTDSVVFMSHRTTAITPFKIDLMGPAWNKAIYHPEKNPDHN